MTDGEVRVKNKKGDGEIIKGEGEGVFLYMKKEELKISSYFFDCLFLMFFGCNCFLAHCNNCIYSNTDYCNRKHNCDIFWCTNTKF